MFVLTVKLITCINVNQRHARCESAAVSNSREINKRNLKRKSFFFTDTDRTVLPSDDRTVLPSEDMPRTNTDQLAIPSERLPYTSHQYKYRLMTEELTDGQPKINDRDTSSKGDEKIKLEVNFTL
jgi:hypothetical protein